MLGKLVTVSGVTHAMLIIGVEFCYLELRQCVCVIARVA